MADTFNEICRCWPAAFCVAGSVYTLLHQSTQYNGRITQPEMIDDDASIDEDGDYDYDDNLRDCINDSANNDNDAQVDMGMNTKMTRTMMVK